MVVGICTLSLFLPYSHSLKDKRKVLHGLKERLKRYNVSVAEVDGQDVWQRSTLGFAAVSDARPHLEETFRRIREEIESRIPGEIVDQRVDYV